MTKRVLVVGGGVAGPVTAIALQQAGLEPVLYEARDAASDGQGAFLTLAVNGLAALEPLDLTAAVDRLGMATPAMSMVNGRGKPLGSMPMRARTLTRADLYRVLREEAERRGIPVAYGKRLVGCERDGSGGRAGPGVRAQFDDGSSADGDLLVGADGLRSRTRTLIDPQAPPARHLGLLNTGGFARGLHLPGEPGVAHFVFGRSCFFGYFLHPDGDVWWFANPPGRTEAGATADQWRARLVRMLAADTGPMLDIIAATEQLFSPWATYDVPTVPRWHDDRMVIVGDAAHATSPASGQGASMAIEDGVVLATCLRDIADPAGAFQTYTSLRRERVERVVRQGKRSGDGKALGPVAARLRDLMMPMIMRRMASGRSLDWMYDYRIDWEAPQRSGA